MMAAATLIVAASGASAADRDAADAIVAGHYNAAEQALRGELQVFPRRPDLMLNLATVYRAMGHEANSRELYADVLRRQDVMMDVVDGRTVSSHTLARTGLQRLNQIAAR